MAVITPQSDVYLLKVPLEINDINQLTFSNATAQYNYFSSLPKLTVDNFTYQRKDGTIRFPACFDDLLSYNYVMYRNDAYSNKWFYAFISGMEYLNDNVTAIAIKTDVWQTYQFDLTYKPTLVEREHVNDDTVGKHTYPEDLELGEMVANGTVTNFGINETVGDYCIVIDVSMLENPGDAQTLTYSWSGSQTTPTQYINGIPTGLYHIILGYNQSVVTSPRDVIDVYDKAGLSEAIQSVYILPKALLGSVQNGLTIETTGSAPSGSVGGLSMPVPSTSTTSLSTSSFTRPTSIDSYIPKNKKLLCYPFCYFNISNNAGTSQVYRYEDFTSTVTFNVEGTFGVSGNTKAIPQNYRNISSSENALDYSVSGAKYPVCGWTTDTYTNWLTQNAVNMSRDEAMAGVQGIMRGVGAGVGALALMASGGGVLGAGALIGASLIGGGVGSMPVLNTVMENLKSKTSANLRPDQAHGNINSGDFVWSKIRSKFTYIPMSIKAEYAKICDAFFSAYGYAINEVKLPNITGRRNWNYVKTTKCYIEADIPQDDLQEIKDMFDKGITLWHNPSTFVDYSQNNDII